MSSFIDGFALGLVCLLVLGVGINGLGHTLMWIALRLYESGHAIQRAQDQYGRSLAARWIRKLEG